MLYQLQLTASHGYEMPIFFWQKQVFTLHTCSFASYVKIKVTRRSFCNSVVLDLLLLLIGCEDFAFVWLSPCYSTNIVFSDIFPFNIFIQRIFVPIYVVLIGYIDKHIIFICIPQIFKQSKHIVSCRAEPIFIFMQNVFGLKYDREYHVYWLPFAILCR